MAQSSGPIGPAADIATLAALRSAAPEDSGPANAPQRRLTLRSGMPAQDDRGARAPSQEGALGERSGPRGLVGPSPLLYGRAVTLRVPATHVPTPIVSAAQPPPSEHARPWTVVIQAEALPLFPASTVIAGALNITIRYMLGAARFIKVATIGSLAVTRIPVQANNIQVEVQWVPPVGEGPPALLAPQQFTVNVAVEPSYLQGLEQYAPYWLPSTAPFGSAFYAPGPGYWLAASGGMVAMPLASPAYVLALDAGPLDAVATAAVLGTSPPLVAAGQAFSFNDENGPALAFSRGLWLALSSTPAVYSAPVGGTFYADVKAGT